MYLIIVCGYVRIVSCIILELPLSKMLLLFIIIHHNFSIRNKNMYYFNKRHKKSSFLNHVYFIHVRDFYFVPHNGKLLLEPI